MPLDHERFETGWTVKTLDNTSPTDALADATIFRGAVHALSPSASTLRDYARAATEYRRQTSCASRSRSMVAPRARARGAGRPRVRRGTARTAASSDPGGSGGDPPGPRPVTSRCGEVAR